MLRKHLRHTLLGQFLARCLHSWDLGVNVGQDTRRFLPQRAFVESYELFEFVVGKMTVVDRYNHRQDYIVCKPWPELLQKQINDLSTVSSGRQRLFQGGSQRGCLLY